MRKSRLLVAGLVVGLAGYVGHPRAQSPPPPSPATLHAVGDLPGGGFTTVIRDATKAGGVIYAVGGAVTRITCPSGPSGPEPCNTTDTAFLWRFDGTNETMEALPDLVINTDGISNESAFDITPDAAYIASQARSVPSGPAVAAVRVTRNDPPSTSANLNLTTLVPLASGSSSAAFATSNDGTILYGSGRVPTGPGGTLETRAVRYDTLGGTSEVIPKVCAAVSAPECPAAHNLNFVAARGTSADGSVAVGSSFSTVVPSQKAYRYEYGTGVTAIPLLPGGTFNNALAVSPAGSPVGDLVLVAGNSSDTVGTNEEVYLYTASTGAIQRLGSPNGYFGLGGRLCTNGGCSNITRTGGMTADGSVVAMNFVGSGVGDAGGSHAYFHNEHGWFHLKSALAANGVDFWADGWGTGTGFLIHGISPDGTLVFGSGVHNGDIKGFVAEFAPGVLASFDPQAAPPASTSIVGAWTLAEDDISAPGNVLVFTADGAYFQVNGNGFERGYYTFDGSQFAIVTLFDNNGTEGLSRSNGLSFSTTVDGDTLMMGGETAAHRVAGVAGSIVGGWVTGDPTQPDSSFVGVFLGEGSGLGFFQATDDPDFGDDGSDVGTYTWDPFTHELVIFPLGGGSPDEGNFVTLSPDELGLHALGDDGDELDLTRVIDPRTPRITSALAATATTGLSFAYQIAATNGPSTFGAVGLLPTGLGFDSYTGLIWGTPTETGTFDVLIEASNTLSTSTGRNHLSLTVIAPVEIAPSLEPVLVTPIEPEDDEPPPVTIEFTSVNAEFTISVATIDPATVLSAPEPPAGFKLGDNPVYYEITPSNEMAFDGPVKVCFSYAGVTFAGEPTLLHYDVDLMDWVNITLPGGVDTDAMTICGLTSSFTPFAIAASVLGKAVGFHQPIEPVAGALNAVKGGATVPLKFNVYGNDGVEIINPADIVNPGFQVSSIACDTGAPVEDVEAESTGQTVLRYDTASGQFVQNWKTPKTPGKCYLAKVTGDGLLLSARIKVK